MTNRLKMPKVQSILTLRERGWTCKRIAQELGIHRETVSAALRNDASPDLNPLSINQFVEGRSTSKLKSS